MMLRHALTAFLGCALVPLAAHASWSKLSSGDSSVYLTGLTSPDGTLVFAAGSQLDQSGTFPMVHPRVYASTDAGHHFTDISGNLAHVTGLQSTGAIAFADAQHGWVSVGTQVYWTTSGGSSWTAVSVGANTNDLHAFDTTHIVRAGDNGSVSFSSDGGQTWKPASMPSPQVSLQRMYWTDGDHGWVSGQIADDNGIASETDVFFTSDGGHTWTAGATLSGVAAGPIFFLGDQQTGWLTTRQQTDMSDQPDPNQAIAHLSKTTDGGRTFKDTALPTNVGTASIFGGSQPINTATLYALYWADANRGHLVGGAYLGSESTSMSGGMTSTSQTTGFWKIIDYQTTDGGQTWQKTNLGTIQESLGTPPPTDGQFSWGIFHDLDNGWLSANADTVWGYAQTCTTNSDCMTGFACDMGRCVEVAGSSDGGTTPGNPTTGGTDGGTSSGPSRLGKVGCSCSGGDLSAWPLLLGLLARRRRRR